MLIKYLHRTLDEPVRLTDTVVVFIDSVGDVPDHEAARLLSIPGYVEHTPPAVDSIPDQDPSPVSPVSPQSRKRSTKRK